MGVVNTAGDKKSSSVFKSLSDATKLDKNDDAHGQIINEKFTLDGTSQKGDTSKEEINILMDYKWTIDDLDTGNNGNLPIPHCYAIEYKQLHNSAITNLINSVSAGVTAVSAATTAPEGETSSPISNVWTGIKDLMTSLIQSQNSNSDSGYEDVPIKNINIGTRTEELFSNTKNINGLSGSRWMKPYSLLYWLKETNKQYVFPMVAQPPIQSLINNYQEQYGDTSILSSNSLLTSITSLADGLTGLSKDIVDLSNMMVPGNSSSYSMAGVEKAKFFQYPQQTDEYTISFPLLNTVKSTNNIPEWVKNYKFILLFTLRNMIFRRDNASFYPPLFYDLVIPGVIRQPFCYVSNVQVRPLGMVRQMSTTDWTVLNFVGDNSKSTSITVPDAWIVTIKFKSLLASSANMVLSSMYDLGIEADIDRRLATAATPGSVWDTTGNIA